MFISLACHTFIDQVGGIMCCSHVVIARQRGANPMQKDPVNCGERKIIRGGLCVDTHVYRVL